MCTIVFPSYLVQQTQRITNPLGTSLSFITVFGDKIIALVSDGSRMLVWDTTDSGEYLFIWRSRSQMDDHSGCLQGLLQMLSSQAVSPRLQSYTRQRTSTKCSSQAAKGPCSFGIFALSTLFYSPRDVSIANDRSRRTCVHKFEASRLRDSFAENSPAAITALVQSPAIDVVGIGFSTGEIAIYDIRADERLMRIFMEGGVVNSLAFRSGVCFQHPFASSY